MWKRHPRHWSCLAGLGGKVDLYVSFAASSSWRAKISLG
jgi:hypothetical protein